MWALHSYSVSCFSSYFSYGGKLFCVVEYRDTFFRKLLHGSVSCTPSLLSSPSLALQSENCEQFLLGPYDTCVSFLVKLFSHINLF